MLVGNQWTCIGCGGTNTLSAKQQRAYQAGRLTDWCTSCSQAAADVRQQLGLPEQLGIGFEDIRQLLQDASAPLDDQRPTFWQQLRGVDLQAEQLDYKQWAAEEANYLTAQRTAQINEFTRLVKAAREFHVSKMDAQLEMTRKRVEFLRIKAEEAALLEAAAHQQALQEERLKTQRLEETHKQVRLLNAVNPPPPVQPVDPIAQAITDHRKQFKAKATARQLVISDFLKELQKVFRANIDDVEKAARIRAVMEAYKQEVDALPKVIREFLEEVEQAEGVSRE